MKPRVPPPSRLAPLLALILGALSVLSFAPFGYWPLQILTLAALFALVLRAPSVKSAAWLGWAYGFGWLVAGVYWLYISMHDYGGMPGWMAALAVAALAAGMGVYAALATGVASWFSRRWQLSRAVTLVLVLPSTWALGEWLRGWMLTGFPWIASGYAHSTGPLGGYAPLVGVYGIAWIAAFIAGCLVLVFAKRWAAALAAAVILLAGFGLRGIEWTQPHGEPISVRLLQGNVPQEMKFVPEQISATLQLYHELIGAAPADLIATPETAVPLLSSQLPRDYLPLLSTLAQKSNSHLILGIPISDGPGRYANSVLGFGPTPSAEPYRYDKHHLVPFGEFIPFGFRWFVEMMHIPLGDFTPGALRQAPFAVKDQHVLPNICYEDLFGEEIAAQIAASVFSDLPQATILLNVSNIAWFGDSIALPQHLQISQMRTLETGRPMLRATNTGATAVIDARGQIAAQVPPFERTVLSARVQGHSGYTPYVLYGNKLPVALFLLALATALFLGKRRARSASRRA